MAMAPADQRFGVGMQAVIQAVLGGKELRRQGRYPAGMVTAGLGQAAHLATGAKSLGAFAAQQHADDVRVIGPGLELFVEHLDHRQRQGIEGLWRIECGDADARAVDAGEFFALYCSHGRPLE
ncbi:hypothetical protein D3C76_1219340 [compost metagenome]